MHKILFLLFLIMGCPVWEAQAKDVPMGVTPKRQTYIPPELPVYPWAIAVTPEAMAKAKENRAAGVVPAAKQASPPAPTGGIGTIGGIGKVGSGKSE